MPFLAPLLPVLGNIAVNLAIGVGLSVVSNLINPQQKNQPQTQTQTVTTSRGFSFEMAVGESVPVSAVTGLGRAKGQLMYFNEFGENNDYLQMVIKIGYGWHDGMDAFLLDEKPAALSGSNADPRGKSIDALTMSGVPYGWVKYYTGAPGQVADHELVAQSNPVGRWTNAHKMTGCAYIILTFRYHPDLYGSALPLSGSVWRGLRLYDWRVPGAVWGDQSTYVFTKNPAVIRYNFRRGIFVNGVKVLGQGFSAYANDLAGYTAAANVCDEAIFEPVSGKTFARYEFGREIGDDEEKLSVLQELDDSYCGSSFKRGGADVPLPAQQLVSAMTLTDKDRIVGKPVRADRKGSVSQKKTAFHGQFVSQDVGWGLAPFTPRINADLESALGGRRSIALDQPYEYLQERAQARAEIRLRRQFYPATRVETFTPKALALEPGDPITRVCEWGTMLMVVEKVEPLEGRLGATVTMTEWSNTIVPASGDTFVVLPSGRGAGPANPDRTIAVSGINVVPFSRSGGGAVHPYGKATWTPVTDPNLDQVMIRVWPSDATEDDDHEDFFADSKLTSTKLLGPLQPLTTYACKAIPIRSDGRQCVWTNTAEFTTGAELTPAEVADNSVGIDKLVQEIRNRMDQITNEIPERILQLEAEMAQQADNSMNQAENAKKLTNTLVARMGSAIAAVLQEKITRAEADSAIAIALTQVLAQVDNLFASGSIRFESRVSGGGAEATIALMVRVGMEDDYADSGISVKAIRDGSGGTLTEILFLAEKLSITDGINTKNAFSFDAASGSLVLKSLRFEDIKSLDGETIVLDGIDGGFSVTVP